MRTSSSIIAAGAATVCVAVSAVLCLLAWREVSDVYQQLKRCDG